MWLALETASPRLSVALGEPGRVLAERHADGPRQHGALLLPFVDALLEETGTSRRALRGVVLADGPGSFTGLRLGAAVAKALLHAAGLELRVASTLLGRAWAARPPGAGDVVAVTSALRGEWFAARYALDEARVHEVAPPAVLREDALRRLLAGAAVVTADAAAPPLPDAPAPPWRREPVQAGALLGLLAVAGGTWQPAEPLAWEPDYGRPAEAQARWEATHGRTLVDPDRASR